VCWEILASLGRPESMVCWERRVNLGRLECRESRVKQLGYIFHRWWGRHKECKLDLDHMHCQLVRHEGCSVACRLGLVRRHFPLVRIEEECSEGCSEERRLVSGKRVLPV